MNYVKGMLYIFYLNKMLKLYIYTEREIERKKEKEREWVDKIIKI